jgi:hypothetical protein
MSQEYARLLKSNYPTIDAALKPKHLFQMTVSATHSINMNGLHQALTGLGLVQKQCNLYFVVPPDIYPIFKNPSIVPSGKSLPDNVGLMVLELPLQRVAEPTASADTAVVTAGGGKRKVIDTDTPVSWRMRFSVFPNSLTLCVPVVCAALVCGRSRAVRKEACYHYL